MATSPKPLTEQNDGEGSGISLLVCTMLSQPHRLVVASRAHTVTACLAIPSDTDAEDEQGRAHTVTACLLLHPFPGALPHRLSSSDTDTGS